MRKAVAGFAGEQPNAMLALSAEERFFLPALKVKRPDRPVRALGET